MIRAQKKAVQQEQGTTHKRRGKKREGGPRSEHELKGGEGRELITCRSIIIIFMFRHNLLYKPLPDSFKDGFSTLAIIKYRIQLAEY
ncbi:hypothetical protein RJ639_045137 [Escallonia herrerae]|uniref:Uncharacterized protein n=1 Tax=Escallonia herrerae TaxID=1293975 RepID=A0AA88W514_9ASTE|nr:hypothetical protein RJ639_045137 [Escallonia herrerae]